ncbi:MAG: metallophosphoesterase [Opitutales bacterium]|nr:metallophosphoesterase [Opitutales bacterium]
MDRRSFAKTTIALAAAGSAVSACSEEPAPKAPAPKTPEYDPKMKLPLDDPTSWNGDSDEAQEQIKVIQSKRDYRNQHKREVRKCTSILFFADVHLIRANLSKIRRFYEKYKMHLDDAVHLGDAVGSFFRGSFTLWDSFPTALNIIGNHETYLNDNYLKKKAGKPKFKTMPDRDKYDNYFKKYVGSWGVRQPENAEAEGKCYWLKDYSGHVRIIGVDCMRLDSDAQFEWFKSALGEAAEKNLTVAIATHVPPDAELDIPSNFTSLDYHVPYKSGTCGIGQYKRYLGAVDDFIGAGGNFAAWICGHTHTDMLLYAAGTKRKQFVLVMECATNFSDWTDAQHIRNTASETCWEVVSIEEKTNVIKVARFGNNFDHYLRHKGAFCYDFKNHKLISQY